MLLKSSLEIDKNTKIQFHAQWTPRGIFQFHRICVLKGESYSPSTFGAWGSAKRKVSIPKDNIYFKIETVKIDDCQMI